MEMLIRFVVGGFVISSFAVLGDVFKPKSFAGLFAAAPTVALATIWLTMRANGSGYVALDGRSMVAGAIAQIVYACVCALVLMRGTLRAITVSLIAMPVWFAVAGGLWLVWLRR